MSEVEEKNYPKFDYSALCKALERKSTTAIDKESFEKTTKLYEN